MHKLTRHRLNRPDGKELPDRAWFDHWGELTVITGTTWWKVDLAPLA